MPFTQYKKFGPGSMEVMTAAYDAVVAKLGLSASDPRTSQIAAKIVRLVSEGERDIALLCDKTIAELSK